MSKAYSFILIQLFIAFFCKQSEADFDEVKQGDITDINQVFEARENVSKTLSGPLISATVETPHFLGSISNIQCSNHCLRYEVPTLELKDAEKSRGFLAFKNFYQFEGIVKKGQCRGHTIMTQKFNSLGVYCNDLNIRCEGVDDFSCRRKRVCQSDPFLKEGRDCHPDKLTSTCRSFYKKIIKDISAGKMRAIPGYSNLMEFSSDPHFVKDIKREISKYLAKYNTTKSRVERKTSSMIINTFLEVEKRVKKNFTPYLGIKGTYTSSLRNHAISVYDIKNIDGSKRLCVRDSNAARIIEEQILMSNSCQNYIYISAGRVYYHRHDVGTNILTKMNLYGDEDKRTLQYVREYQHVCEKIKSREKLCISDDVHD